MLRKWQDHPATTALQEIAGKIVEMKKADLRRIGEVTKSWRRSEPRGGGISTTDYVDFRG
jgi:hypothetical protein